MLYKILTFDQSKSEAEFPIDVMITFFILQKLRGALKLKLLVLHKQIKLLVDTGPNAQCSNVEKLALDGHLPHCILKGRFDVQATVSDKFLTERLYF